jgi:hypothetical protein
VTVTFTVAGLDAMQDELAGLSKRGLGYAGRETVNSLAFEGRSAWQDEMRRSLTLRNRFTERRALVEPARTTRLKGMHAVLGHTEPYMGQLEAGGREYAAKRRRPIPTEVAAGQAFGSLRSGRKRAVKPANIIRALGRRIPGGSGGTGARKARNARAIRAAVKSGRRLAFLDLGKRQGIFRVKGRGSKPKLQKLYDVSHRSTRVPRIATLERAFERVRLQGPAIAHRALSRQLARVKGQA